MKKLFIFVFLAGIIIVGYFFYKNGYSIVPIKEEYSSIIICQGTNPATKNIANLESDIITWNALYDSSDHLMYQTFNEDVTFHSNVHKSDYDKVVSDMNDKCNQNGISECTVEDKNFKVKLRSNINFKYILGSPENITIPYEFIRYATKNGLSCKVDGVRKDALDISKVKLGDATIGTNTKALLMSNIKEMVETAESNRSRRCFSNKNSNDIIKFNYGFDGYYKISLGTNGKVSKIKVYDNVNYIKVEGTSLNNLIFEKDYDYNEKDYKC